MEIFMIVFKALEVAADITLIVLLAKILKKD
jgi:hypothetical protein